MQTYTLQPTKPYLRAFFIAFYLSLYPTQADLFIVRPVLSPKARQIELINVQKSTLKFSHYVLLVWLTLLNNVLF